VNGLYVSWLTPDKTLITGTFARTWENETRLSLTTFEGTASYVDGTTSVVAATILAPVVTPAPDPSPPVDGGDGDEKLSSWQKWLTSWKGVVSA